jgi:hypothetical protein
MARADIPTPVRDLIARHVDSAQQVEILLLLAEDPDRPWTADAVARALRIAPGPCTVWLERFSAAALIDRSDEGFTYARGRVDTLLEYYATRRLAVLDLIYSKPNPAIQSFADAFRMRDDEEAD